MRTYAGVRTYTELSASLAPEKTVSVLCYSALWLLILLSMLPLSAAQAIPPQALKLESGWELQTSAKVTEPGDVVSTERFRPKEWYPVTVPTTVVAALVKARVYPDPEFAMNLRSFPGMGYPIAHNFSELPMPANSPFAVPWWYRKTFSMPSVEKGRKVWLNFDGINYRANIWLNGKQLADTTTIAGAWRHYEIDVTNSIKPGSANVLAVEVSAPTEKDLAITFVDWNPAPPDKEMGLFHEVYITTSGPVALRGPAAFSEVNSPANDQAKLTVVVEARNAEARPVDGLLRGRIQGVNFSQKVSLGAGETREIRFVPAEYPQLVLHQPELWWPTQMGTPHLYPLHLEFEVNGHISDEVNSRFGIRQITSEVTSPTRRLFRINGKPLLIRGGGWSNDFLLRINSERMKQQLDYVADMRLNTIRLEGRPETQELYDEADRRGILVMAGWSCCDFWEQWPKWTDEDHDIAKASLRAQMLRLRGHPSLLMWLNGSDHNPPPDQEAVYLGIESEMLWPNPILSSATARLGTNQTPNGVRMTGPYDYVAPEYWMEDSQADQPGHGCDLGGCGGAHGFNTETSPGPAVPPIESLKRMFGKDHLWPMDAVWDYHAGGGAFGNLNNYSQVLNQRYGTATSAEDYAQKSQLMAYEGIRAMYEGYSRNKYVSTGVIQWMLNNAWPSTIWHLFDAYLRPGGGYFGAKTALQPLHPLYSYDDHSIWVVSSQYKDAPGLKLSVQVFNMDMTSKFSRDVNLDAPADSTKQFLVLPQLDGLSSTYFLKLLLTDAEGKRVGSNFYWLSTKQETLDWSKSNWYTTPVATTADNTALKTLPRVKLISSARTEVEGDELVTHVTLKNPGKQLAFFVRLKLNKGARGEEILPVLWEDNYVSLMPGESRELTARVARRDADGSEPTLEVQGWNVQ